MADIAKYLEIFDFLSAPSLPTSQEPAIVFGRNDQLVAQKLVYLASLNLVEAAVITGGIGKDTGDLLKQGYHSEAHFLDDTASQYAYFLGFSLPQTYLDEKASNGGENARNGLDILVANGHNMSSLTTVLHATSARRLSETVKFEAQKKGLSPKVHVAPSNYGFDPTKLKDQDESASELLRLADWPKQNQLGTQEDLPENLVDFARERHGDAPKPVAPWQANLLRVIPKGPRLQLIKFAAEHGRK